MPTIIKAIKKIIRPNRPLKIPNDDFINPNFDRKSTVAPNRIVVIFSTPRSGSTMVCDLLHSANVCIAHEYFQPFQYMPLLKRRYKIDDCSERASIEYYDALKYNRTSELGVFGVNVHGRHLEAVEPVFDLLMSEATDIFFLRRRKLVDQALSYAISRQTKQWTSKFKKSREVKIDVDIFNKCLADIVIQNEQISSILESKNIDHSLLFYEDLLLQMKTKKSISLNGIGEVDVQGLSISRQSHDQEMVYTEYKKKILHTYGFDG